MCLLDFVTPTTKKKATSWDDPEGFFMYVDSAEIPLRGNWNRHTFEPDRLVFPLSHFWESSPLYSTAG